MNTDQRERFEDRLLVALREIVAERAAAAPAEVEQPRAVPVRPVRWRPRLALAVGATALGAAAAVVLPSVLGGDSAYAVARQEDGTIRVEIRQVSDAQGLERRLAELGIPAEVDYLPDGQVCRQPRYAEAAAGAMAGGSGGGGPGGDSGGEGDHRADYSGGSASFTLRPADFASGETLVIATAGRQSLSAIEVAVVEGPVLPCVPVSAEDQRPVRPGGPTR
ncbi:hypothetical protein [Actinophytocola xanthii]|uniref:Uncharacterized protein n=1 Tax=Actinophytocola xanthii TaxID=1912961 RepID=A0A1Q8CVY0_9PSEU|nr:hypothetical protein [Actinophytocola xanthii]OLF18517.1 hypothetical protein BU204_06080 [Actinophytocola xanthii]